MSALTKILDAIAAGELTAPGAQLLDLTPPLRHTVERALDTVKKRISAADRNAARDDLTGVLTAGVFRHMVVQRLSRGPVSAAMLSIGVSNLKRINETRGHAAGDQLLALAASRITSALELLHLKSGGGSQPPLICRLGGNKFAAFIEIDHVEEAQRCARDLLNALKEPFFVSQRGILAGARIGIALAPEHGRRYDHLLRHADLAADAARAAGSNRFFLFEQALADRSRQRATTEAMLREAIIEEQFFFHFQPQARRSADGPQTVEALLRWNHPQQGLIMPGDFIGLAEEAGLIGDIGRWVIASAIRTAARWQAMGQPCRIAVNASAFELLQNDYVDHLEEWLARTGVSPDLIEIEVTESAMMTADDVIVERLRQLHATGVSLAIDDFGTGYSNFSRLTSLPIDRLKIDRSLVRDVLTSPVARQVVNCIVQLGRALGHQIVVEGIETEDQAALFRAMECDALQGFHIARPIPETELLQWMAAASGAASLSHAA